ncbi:hypothetical protein B0T25DRAFT_541973 [Lasiosphaeria hispida]|uniref:Uncharacterized protein n=1 Tax=Lasiosphaeria hispida TaxID=260671 RepID=A0AAJ0HGV2_9PEZI|nr:hypothetical protein B0T25DRAFT_541973 [Lasiosphaeria hispida]
MIMMRRGVCVVEVVFARVGSQLISDPTAVGRLSSPEKAARIECRIVNCSHDLILKDPTYLTLDATCVRGHGEAVETPKSHNYWEIVLVGVRNGGLGRICMYGSKKQPFHHPKIDTTNFPLLLRN